MFLVWFGKLVRQFFFMLDEGIYNGITEIYRLLIDISRTSVLSQASIQSVANRIYQLLAVFMTFKVIFSLIMYVVNPDDFSDKSKGISKLGANIVITLALLVLTPFIFNYAFQLQNIILEKNNLGVLIFGDFDNETDDKDFSIFIEAGNLIAFNTMKPFFTPDSSIEELSECVSFEINGKINPKCSGIDLSNSNQNDGDEKYYNDVENSLAGLALEDDGKYSVMSVANYVYGMEKKNLGMMFRPEMAMATYKSSFVIDYKFYFSLPIGVIVVLLLITFCMDVALRSVKLAFLQLIAPIPILSYIDPKGGKDGMFKKWYQMCFNTYLSLFVRLLGLYFAIFVITKIDRMSDVLTGAYQSSLLVKIFVIVGALMFAKQLPNILKGLGIKLDGDGKFTLNPLKKFEEEALGGKRITGAARGFMVGTAGAFTGAGVGRMFTGAIRGATAGKGWKETGKAEREMNTRMRNAIANGSTFGGRLASRTAAAFGLPTGAEFAQERVKKLEGKKKDLDNRKQSLELQKNQEKKEKQDKYDSYSKLYESGDNVFKLAKAAVEKGKGKAGAKLKAAEDNFKTIEGKHIGDKVMLKKVDAEGKVTYEEKTLAQDDFTKIHNDLIDQRKNAAKNYIQEQIDADPGKKDAEIMNSLENAILTYKDLNNISEDEARKRLATADSLKSETDSSKNNRDSVQTDLNAIDRKYSDQEQAIKEELEEITNKINEANKVQQRKQANDDAVK